MEAGESDELRVRSLGLGANSNNYKQCRVHFGKFLSLPQPLPVPFHDSPSRERDTLTKLLLQVNGKLRVHTGSEMRLLRQQRHHKTVRCEREV